MPLSHVIDLEKLLAPIADDNPTGEDIRNDRSPTSDYYAIKDARNSARAAERSSMFDDEVDLITPWRQVVELAPSILTNKSKDLEVASWYTEALIRLHGTAGLRDGLRLIQQMVEQYWDGLYPEPDEDGMETKVAPLTGMNGDGGEGTLHTPIRNMAITGEGAFGEFNFWQYQKARDNDRISDEDERNSRAESLGFALKDILATVNEDSVDTYIDLIDTLEESLEDYKTLNNALREHCGQDAPPSSQTTALIEEVLRTVRFISKDKVEAAQALQQAQEPVATASGEESVATELVNQAIAATQGTSGPISNREDALKRLQEVADYFRRYEPHTPIAPGLERLINWGRMTVAELMMELLPDDQAKGIYSQLTGVKLDGSDTETYTAHVAPPVTPAASTAAPAAPKAEPVKEEASAATGW
jgi:type VI secretion system protein ImpA